MKKALGIIQGRCGSVRLPNKMLADINGLPLLTLLLKRLKNARNLSHLVLATTRQEEDHALARLATAEGVQAFHGDQKDVFSRFWEIACTANEEWIVRLNGDSPFIDPLLIDQVVEYAQASEADLITTANPRTVPSGFSVEVIRRTSLIAVPPADPSEEEREHVTLYFYNRRPEFRIDVFQPQPPASLDISLAVDLQVDLDRARRLARELGPRLFSATWREICDLGARLGD